MDQIGNLSESFNASGVIRENGKVGYRNSSEVLLPAIYDDMKLMNYGELEKGTRVVVLFDGKWGIVCADGAGTWLVQPVYDYIGYPNRFTNVSKDGKWGVLNVVANELLIPVECDKVSDDNGFMFTNGIGMYEKDNLVGPITNDGQFTSAIFDEADFTGEGPVPVKYKEIWGYVNEKNMFTEDEDEAYYRYSLD